MAPTNEIESDIRLFLSEQFLSGRGGVLHAEDRLLGSVIDSAGVIEFVMFLQDKFSIAVEDDDVNAENLDSIKRVVAFVDRKLKYKANA